MRRMPAQRSLDRNAPKISPKVEIYIVCEGENTEPDYLQACAGAYSAGLVRIHAIKGAGVPYTLVTEAVRLREALRQRYRKSRNSFDSCFRVWAVFDRDEHPRIDEAFEMAKQGGVDVAFSDPCFELWPILHLEEYGAQAGRHELQKYLSQIMEGYNHGQGAVINFPLIKDRVDDAFTRAERLLAARAAEGCPNGRPSTTVGNLVKKIIENGKRR